MDCLVCGAATRVAFETLGEVIHECRACMHRMLAPPADEAAHLRATFGDHYFEGGGVGYPDYRRERRLLVEHGRRYARLLARLRGGTPGTVLDVGAAAGYLLSGFAAEGWSVAGVEPNARMAALAREELPGATIEVATADSFAPRTPVDALTLVQVVAHLSDPRRALAPLRDALVPGGLLLIETWNWRSPFARAFGHRWHEYAPPSARQWFTPGSLERWLAPAGFTQVSRGRPPKRLEWAHARSLARERWHGSPLYWPVAVANRLVPEHAVVPYPALDLFWMVFRRAT